MSSITATTLDLDTLVSAHSAITLQRGDNDARGIWGGQPRPELDGEPVRQLQQALVAMGAMSATPDGDFGRKTQDAVRRFQWYLGRIGARLRVSPGSDELHGTLETYAAPTGVQVDGFVRRATLLELRAWMQAGCVLTSPLVRLSLGGFSEITLSGTFTVLDYPSPGSDEMLVHQDFVPAVQTLNTAAKAAKVQLRINQAFRVQNLPVSGAVVPPATNSQHLIGHAVDLNIVDGSTVNTSAMYFAGTETQGAKDFIAAVKAASMRWGGDFGDADPPHFDDLVPASSDEYVHSFYFAQRSFAAQHPLRTA
jgi:peptidoglycan hydrolase-like protein with peptidoglycan-binding domain